MIKLINVSTGDNKCFLCKSTKNVMELNITNSTGFGHFFNLCENCKKEVGLRLLDEGK